MPSEVPADPTRERLTDLRNGMLRLHKVVLDSERATYDRDVERIRSTSQFLDLVLHDPFFAWLRELSQLIVWIDERLAAEEPADAAEATPLIRQVRALLTPAELGTGFQKNYFAAMQRDPGVVLAHAEMVKIFTKLSTNPPPETETL
jgi:hypothetical protein